MKIKILWAAAMVLCLSLAGCWSLIYSQGAKNVFLNSVLEVGRIGIVDADTAQRWMLNVKRWLEK